MIICPLRPSSTMEETMACSKPNVGVNERQSVQLPNMVLARKQPAFGLRPFFAFPLFAAGHLVALNACPFGVDLHTMC